jgi:hypothetical protein
MKLRGRLRLVHSLQKRSSFFGSTWFKTNNGTTILVYSMEAGLLAAMAAGGIPGTSNRPDLLRPGLKI